MRHKKQDTFNLSPAQLPEALTAALEVGNHRQSSQAVISHLSPAQILEQLTEILVCQHPHLALDVLERTGALELILPEIRALVGFGDAVKHKDVWAHTKQVIRQCKPEPLLRWAALLHDIGKVPTRKFEKNGQVTFIGHPEIGRRMFIKICRRLPFPPPAKNRIAFLIASHLRASSYAESWTDSAVRRFYRECGDGLRDLLALSRADITSKYDEKVLKGLGQINKLAKRVESLKIADATPPALPGGLGKALMDHFELTPGPHLGQIMARLKVLVEQNQLPPNAAHDIYIDQIKKTPHILG